MDIRSYSNNSNFTALEKITTNSIDDRVTPRVINSLDLERIEGLTDIARANVRVSRHNSLGESSSGSGFSITEDGLIITNKHVLFPDFLMNESKDMAIRYLRNSDYQIKVNILKEPKKEGIVIANVDGTINTHDKPDYETYIADIIDFDDNHDIALIKLRAEPGTKLKISETEPSEKDSTYTLSYMHGIKHPIVTWGEVMTKEQFDTEFSKLTTQVEKETVIATDNSVDSGSSGSSLMDRNANSLGIVSYRIKNPKLNSAIKFDSQRYRKDNGETAFSISSSTLLDFLDQAGIKSEHLSDGKVSAGNFQPIIKSKEREEVNTEKLVSNLMYLLLRDFEI